MELIVARAVDRGYAALHASILPENNRMLALVRGLGFTTEATVEGVVEARLALR